MALSYECVSLTVRPYTSLEPDCRIIRSYAQLRQLYEQIRQYDMISNEAMDLVHATLRKYDEAYFQDRDLIVIGSYEANVTVEKAEMPDVQTLCVQSQSIASSDDEGSPGAQMNYERLLVELTIKLPENVELQWLSE